MGDAPALLPGTLDLLILKTLTHGSMHGYGIELHVQRVSKGVLEVGESSLYPALQRLLLNGWVKAEWGESENKRRLGTTPSCRLGAGYLHLSKLSFNQIVAAIQRVLHTA